VETAGAGQTDVKIERIAGTTVVVLAPGLGDEVQMLKAGLMEIGDIYVVNKADDPQASETFLAIENCLSTIKEGWTRPVLKTIATKGGGVEDLIRAMDEHARAARRVREDNFEGVAQELEEVIALKLRRLLDERLGTKGVEGILQEIAAKELDPYTAASRLLEKLGIARCPYGRRRGR